MAHDSPFPDPEGGPPRDFIAEVSRCLTLDAGSSEAAILRGLVHAEGAWYAVAMTEVSFDEYGVDVEALPASAARALLGYWDIMLFEEAVHIAAISAVWKERSLSLTAAAAEITERVERLACDVFQLGQRYGVEATAITARGRAIFPWYASVPPIIRTLLSQMAERHLDRLEAEMAARVAAERQASSLSPEEIARLERLRQRRRERPGPDVR